MTLRRCTRPTIAALMLAVLACLACLAPAGLPTAAALVAAPRASLTDIENDVMCVSCKEPLAVAESPQAYAERNYVRRLIAEGQTKAQIERALVAQYGPAVLGRPPAHGFNLTVYVLPPALLLIGIGALLYTLPRWRRRARAAGERSPAFTAAAGPQLGSEDARRLEEDLSRHP